MILCSNEYLICIYDKLTNEEKLDIDSPKDCPAQRRFSISCISKRKHGD